MKILNILLIVLIGLLLTACGETIENKNNGENNNINNNESKNNILLTIEDEKEMVKQNMFDLLEENNNMLIRDISGKLILRCNLLDCGISSKVEHDELFSGSSPEVEIMTHITFNKIIENQNSLDAYNQNIKNVNLNLYFPEQKSENIRVQTSFYDLKDNLRFTSFPLWICAHARYCSRFCSSATSLSLDKKNGTIFLSPNNLFKFGRLSKSLVIGKYSKEGKNVKTVFNWFSQIWVKGKNINLIVMSQPFCHGSTFLSWTLMPKSINWFLILSAK